MWVPCSLISPLDITNIKSALMIVDKRWATINVVLPLINSFMTCWIFTSVSVSIDDVASSRIKIFGSLMIARAKLINCLSPSESFDPPSPTSVSYLFGRFSMNSWACAFLHASMISSKLASFFPYATFSLIVPLNKCGVCKTYPSFS